MGLGSFFFGKKEKFKKKSLFTPEQEQALKTYLQQGIERQPLFGAGSSFLQDLFSQTPQGLSALEAPYLERFQQQIVPQLAQQFVGQGTGSGALSSSGFQNSLAQQGRGLAADLANLRANLQLQGLGPALQYAQQPFSNQLGGLGVRSFENVYRPATTGLIPGFFQSVAGGAGQALGQSLGQGLGNLFSGNNAITPGGAGFLSGGAQGLASMSQSIANSARPV